MRLTPEQLDGYLARIGVVAPATADLAALTEIHRAHAYGFTWETLDAFMGWPSSLHPHDAYTKMVEGGRGVKAGANVRAGTSENGLGEGERVEVIVREQHVQPVEAYDVSERIVLADARLHARGGLDRKVSGQNR